MVDLGFFGVDAAKSLEVLHALVPERAIPAKALTRIDRERLREQAFLARWSKAGVSKHDQTTVLGTAETGLQACGILSPATALSDS